jgi:hypothetical protein
LDKLKEDIILDRWMRTSCKGDVVYLRVGLKGKHTSKEWWIKKEKLREKFPHLHVD